MLGGERHPVDHRVELQVPERLAGREVVADVSVQHGGLGRQRAQVRGATIQHGQLDAALGGQLRAGRADYAAAADEQNPEISHRRPS